MRSVEAPSKVKYAGRGQQSTFNNSQAFPKAKCSPALERWLQERPEEGHWTLFSPSIQRWIAASPEKDPWSPFSVLGRSHQLPIRLISKDIEKINTVINPVSPAIHQLPQHSPADPDDSTDTDTPPSSDKEAIEPDELRLLARKVYTVLGAVVS